MSLLGKKPFIQDVLGRLSDQELVTLSHLVNESDGATPSELFLYGDRDVLSESNKGVSYVKLSISKVNPTVLKGYLCYASDGTCAFFSFHDGLDSMTEYSINVANLSCSVVQEGLDASEFRSEIDDFLEAKGGEAVISAQALHDKLEGDEFITADLNETSTKVKISLDTDYQPHVVELSGTGGTLSDSDYMKLCGPTSSYTAQILLDGEFYQVGDEQESFDTYVHVGRDNSSQTNVKTIYIYTDESSVNYKNWVLSSSTVVKYDSDGNVELDNNLIVNGQLKLESESHIVDHEGYPIIRDAGYQGYDLTERFAGEIENFSDAWAWIKNRISAANFRGLNIKDYIPLTLNGYTFKMQIAGIDTYYKNGSPEISHHIDFISKELWPTAVQWNLVNNNNGTAVDGIPFMASNVKAYLMAEAMQVPNSTSDNTTLTSVDYTSTGIWHYFPENLKSLIVAKNVFNVNRYNSDGTLRTSENTSWDCNNLSKLWLPDEFEVYGHSVYETNSGAYGNFWRQYPIFEDGSARVKGNAGAAELDRQHWWLMAPYSGATTHVTHVGYNGISHAHNASYSHRVPVCFRIS